MTKVRAIVLAAGAGRRMGGNKGLVSFRGRPLIEHVLQVIAASEVHEALVVVGSEAARLTPVALAAGARVVPNPNWEDGQTSSLQVGIGALPDDTDAFLVHPVDHALVTAEDLNALVRAFAESGEAPGFIARPVCGSVFGHPVLFSRSLADEFLGLEPGRPGHSVYRAHRDSVTLVPVDNPRIGVDLDTPEQLRAHESQEPD